MTAYYNEHDPYAAQWLRNLIAAGHIAPGVVDERSIIDVEPADLEGFTQCHFFAGIGGWSYAARLAGWPDDRPVWTGSCPCQPFSVAGKGAGEKDERHLWPEFFRLIRAARPSVVFGEQVAAAVGKAWLDGVFADLEGEDYATWAAVLTACAVDAPHRRDRLWFVADAAQQCLNGSGSAGQTRRLEPANCGDVDGAFGSELERHAGHGDSRGGRAQAAGPVAETGGAVSDAERFGLRGEGRGAIEAAPAGMQGADGERERLRPDAGAICDRRSAWAGAEWAIGADGKARRVEPGICLLAHGVPARVGKLRAYGNAIVPQVAAEVIGAYLDAEQDRLRKADFLRT